MNIEPIYKRRVERRSAVRKIRRARRYVRTPEGVRRFGLPIGSPITVGASPVLRFRSAIETKAEAPRKPRSGKRDVRAALAPKIRTQTEASKEAGGSRKSDSLADWSEKQRDTGLVKTGKGMLGHFQQHLPDFRDRTSADQIVSDLESNVRYLLGQMEEDEGAIERAKASIMWYVAGSAFGEDLGSAVSNRHADAIGAFLLAVLSPKNEWSNNVGQAVHAVELWNSDEPVSDEILGATYDLAVKEITKTLESKAESLTDKKRALKARKADARDLDKWRKQNPEYNKKDAAKEMDRLGLIRQNSAKSKLYFADGDFKNLEEEIAQLEKDVPMLREQRRVLVGGEGKRAGKAARERFINDNRGVTLAGAEDWAQGFILRSSIDVNEWKSYGLIPLADGSGYEVGDKPVAKLSSPMPGPAEKALAMLRMSNDISSGKMSDDGLLSFIDENLGGGSKVRSFYMNLYDPFDEDEKAVTVDTHMAAGMLLLPVGANSAPVSEGVFSQHTSRGMGNTYPLFLTATRNIAENPPEGSFLTKAPFAGLQPRALQSLIWEYQLSRYGGVPGTYARAKTDFSEAYGLMTMQVLDRFGPAGLQQWDSEIMPKWRRLRALGKDESSADVDKDIAKTVNKFQKKINAYDGKHLSDSELKALLKDEEPEDGKEVGDG